MEKITRIVVMAKQVPDTRNVGKDAMTPEGTVNRAALAAIFSYIAIAGCGCGKKECAPQPAE